MDKDGLELAYKHFTCSTLTIRLCGISQMNYNINNWTEFINLCRGSNKPFTSINGKFKTLIFRNHCLNLEENELADWFVSHHIIEQLFGPNLHVEVIKRSQDIMNFLAFTNRINSHHLDIIWSSGQLKHCSKTVMDTLMSLHKHLSVNSNQYLSKLISQLNVSQQTEQTLLLSSLLTKNLWAIMLNMENSAKNQKNISVNSKNGDDENEGEEEEDGEGDDEDDDEDDDDDDDDADEDDDENEDDEEDDQEDVEDDEDDDDIDDDCERDGINNFNISTSLNEMNFKKNKIGFLPQKSNLNSFEFK
jgi:hypothetical protein